MSFILAGNRTRTDIIIDENAFNGVKRAAGWVAEDLYCVTGKKSHVLEMADEQLQESKYVNYIYAGTLGHGEKVDELCRKAGADVSEIIGKREVFGIFEADGKLIIAGSDKRGTIYGLFRISEAVGVTPMVFWGDTEPRKVKDIIFTTATEAEKMNSEKGNSGIYTCVTGISKEPSVKYRGFFINDEWPAFGNWSQKHFGDANAACYEKIFEYLLRLKGNYMWPAMWSETFWSDGPGLASAELADELGVVMGTSHHEPCIRAGEEFVRLNPVHTEYGKAWNFITNEEGVTKFWEDSLKEREKFENIITVGMRGERDSKLFEDAKLIDNINVLKNVINCQKKLISKYAGNDRNSDGLPPMMLAIYKEVEEYYKGNADTPGLKEWDGLDGITLMLCDDNFGNLRLMPDTDKLGHKGGYGMYYHFDYHGDPISYEWINSSYLPKIWEQMTTCYDFGIREIWIVNVGDLKNQELPLNYFMDMAYDFDTYGTSNPGNYRQYLKTWVAAQFNGLDSDRQATICQLIDGYTRLNNIIKPEVLGLKRYPVTEYNLADEVLNIASELETEADELLWDFAKNKKLKDDILEKIADTANCVLGSVSIDSLRSGKNPDPDLGRFFNSYVSLVYYQAKATFNLVRMWIYADKNERSAKIGTCIATDYAICSDECLGIDRANIELFHSFNNGRWYGMGMSKHIGFRNWNDEGSRNPVLSFITPLEGQELTVADIDSENWSVGGPWCRRPVRLTGFDYRGFGGIDICNAGSIPFDFEISCQDEMIEFKVVGPDELTKEVLTLQGKNALKEYVSAKKWSKKAAGSSDARIYVRIDPKQLKNAAGRHEFTVKSEAGLVNCYFEVREMIFTDGNKYGNISKICINASDYSRIIPSPEGTFRGIPDMGRLLPGQEGGTLKAYPQNKVFKNGPSVEYGISVERGGKYMMKLFTAASNPAYDGSDISFGFSLNGGAEGVYGAVTKDFIGGDRECRDWSIGVLENGHQTAIELKLEKGKNLLSFRAIDPGFVPEKIIIEFVE